VKRGLNPSRERGVALVLVLSMLALVSAWVVTATSEDQLSLFQARNRQLALHAGMAAESGLALARSVLKQDRLNGGSDHLQEAWAASDATFPLADGQVSLAIRDGERYFNINRLVKGGKIQPQMMARLRRLFVLLELPPGLTAALGDWMDADSIPSGPGGAEQAAYAGKAWRVKNAPLDALDEVLLIKGFDAGALEKLRKVCVALPVANVPSVNINTVEPPVLQAMFPAMRADDAGQIVQMRQDAPFDSGSLAALLASARSGWGKGGPLAELTVSSHVFIIRTRARFEGVRRGEELAALRDDKGLLHTIRKRRLAWSNPL